MSRLGVYDNWGRLVAAVIDREKLQQLAFCDSFSSTSSSVATSLPRPSNVSYSFDFGALVANDQVPAPPITRATTTQANGRGGVAALLFYGPLAYYRRRKLQEHDRKLREYDLFVSNFFFDVPAHQLDQLERFSLGELQLATDDFSSKNILGRGGFSKVYKGRLADGSLVAVKKQREENNTNGHDQQFRAEIKVKLNMGEQHPNILQLRGFCLTATERILVYPYMANGSVSSCLRERTESQPLLDSPTRERIALSSAKGLAYLHDQCHKKIIHRDIKAANILLNEGFEAVISDFGLAIFMDHEDTHVTTSIRGTMGHIAPEYQSTGTVSEKADVFGYGVMLLELSTGQRPSCLNYEIAKLLDLVKGHSPKKFEALVDADLTDNHIDGEVVKLIQIALVCCQGSPEKRPKMSDVIQMLQGDDGLSERWHEYCQEDEILRQLDQLERFSLGELQLATDNFSDENVIGRGGFGKVYKGRLADGSLVAVKKKTEEHNTSGYDQQFRAEIKVKLNTGEHPNILQLRGFCLTATERILVYPFIANRTLALCLWERTESQPPLDWPTRERIALSSAKGLAYLHDQCDKKIIHRDIKAANILLNEDLEAVIGDFGLAKFMEHEDTHVTTAVRGTMSHIAPEYRSNGTVSEKTDVFGYGVMLLELSTGQRAFDLARHANYENAMLLDLVKALSKKKFEALVDADLRVNYLRGSYIDGKVVKLIQVALLCCQGSPEKRPKMSDVIQMLQGDNGFTERWQKYWKEEEILPQEYSYAQYHPITDWIVDSIPIVDDGEFELSGPR